MVESFMNTIFPDMSSNNRLNGTSHWGIQIAKSFVLAVSSIGFSWITSRLWSGKPTENTPKTSVGSHIVSLNSRSANIPADKWILPDTMHETILPDQLEPLPVVQKIGIVYRRTYSEDTLCKTGLLIGGIGSIATANPLPLVVGSSLCLPSVSAESTISGNSLIFQAGWDRGPMSLAEQALQSLFTPSLSEVSKSAIVLSAVKEEIDSMQVHSSTDRYQHRPNAIQVRINATARVLKKTEEPKHFPEILNYLTHMHQMLRDQALMSGLLEQTLTNSLNEIPPNLKNNFILYVNELAQKYRKAENQLQTCTNLLRRFENPTQTDLSDLEKVVNSTLESFDEVNTHTNSLDLKEVDLQTLTHAFVSIMLEKSKQGFDAYNEIHTVAKGWRKDQVQGKLSDFIAKGVKLLQIIQKAEESQITFYRELQTLEQGFYLLSSLAGVKKSALLAWQIETIGKATVTIGNAIRSLSQIEQHSDEKDKLGTIHHVIENIYILYHLNMDSSYKDMHSTYKDEGMRQIIQILAKALSHAKTEAEKILSNKEFRFNDQQVISEVPTEGRSPKAIPLRLSHVEQKLEKMHSNTHRRSKELFGNEKQDFYQTSMDGFITLADNLSTLPSYFTNEWSRHIIDIKNNFYKDHFPQCDLEIYFNIEETAQNMRRLGLVQNMRGLGLWAAKGVLLNDLTGTTTDNPEWVANSVQSTEVHFKIQTLAYLAKSIIGLQANTELPNPLLWAHAVHEFLEHLWQIPRSQLEPESRQIYREIHNVGSRFQNFVKELQTTPALYQKLIEEYKKQLLEVRNEIESILNRWKAQPLHLVREVTSEHISSTANDLSVKFADILADLTRIYSVLQSVHKNHTEPLELKLKELVDNCEKLSKESKKSPLEYPCDRELAKRFVNVDYGIESIEAIQKRSIELRNSCEAFKKNNPRGVFETECANVAWFQKLVKKANESRPLALTKIDEFNIVETELKSLNKNFTELNASFQAADTVAQTIKKMSEAESHSYIAARRIMESCAQVIPKIRTERDTTYMFDAVRKQPKQKEIDLYLLHHLTLQDRITLKDKVIQQLDNPSSSLNGAIKSLKTWHVLLEAYLKLGFQSELQNDCEFRKSFENVWSHSKIEQSIRSWDANNPVTHLYIQIGEVALPALENLIGQIVDAASDVKLPSQSVYPLVDEYLQKLVLFETIFFDL